MLVFMTNSWIFWIPLISDLYIYKISFVLYLSYNLYVIYLLFYWCFTILQNIETKPKRVKLDVSMQRSTTDKKITGDTFTAGSWTYGDTTPHQTTHCMIGSHVKSFPCRDRLCVFIFYIKETKSKKNLWSTPLDDAQVIRSPRLKMSWTTEPQWKRCAMRVINIRC